MEQKFCQSCGMPLTEEILGTNTDGSKNEDYCIYCMKDGAFTGNFTMEGMAEYCSMFVDEYNKNTGNHVTACEYKQILLQHYPNLKRWNGEGKNLPHADHPMKKVFIEEVNALGLPELHITNLYVLQGALSIKFTPSMVTRSNYWMIIPFTGATKFNALTAAAMVSPAMSITSSSANTVPMGQIQRL